MSGKAYARKGAAKAAKTARKGDKRSDRATTPGLEPFVNGTAGIAATGLRVGFPANRTVNLNYVDFVPVTSTYGAQGLFQFRLNSAFDPNYTAGGHQPMGFDQWSAYYNHYVVEECSYEITAVPSTASHLVLVTSLSDDATVPSSIFGLMELGGVGTLWAYDTQPHIFKGKVSIPKFFNRTNIATDSELRALTTADPVEAAYLSVSAFGVDGTVDAVVVNLLVKLTYRVRFMEPRDLGPSKSLSPGPPKGPPGEPKKDSPDNDEYEFVRVKKVLM